MLAESTKFSLTMYSQYRSSNQYSQPYTADQ